ncbi:uncharacterized protein si:dkey-32n7.7 isoform X2 [Danio rerio]|uniref:Uncharacterized protein si:dkey-32n7.7 isoform X2 n=1 Tax=Danio rerio TaxID=7955 RepID=A0A8M9Q8R0_DANRE
MESLKSLMIIFLISGMGKAVTAQSCGVSPLNSPGGNVSAGNVTWPWQADLYYFGYRLCGGSLISHEWVLTAAHCVYYIPKSYITVYLGRNSQNASDSNANRVTLSAQSIIIHPDFDSLQFTNDIALLRLAKPVNFTSSISPICLAANDSVFHNGTTCWATGWSYNQDTPSSYGTLPVVMVKVVGNKECDCRYQDIQLYWDITITQTTMCTSGETGYGACSGQLGDPLQCMQGSVWILAGVTNFGFCGTGVAPDVYSKVSEFQSWILNNVNGSDIGLETFKSDGEDKDNSFLCNGEDTVSGLFYPFGNGDTENPSQDHGHSPVVFQKPFVYFGRVYEQTYVNNNGCLTFAGPFSEPIPNVILSKLNRDIIAPFWTNMDNTVNGSISYRQLTKGGLLVAASNDINQYFPHLNFTAYWIFIATWDKVPYFNDSQSSSSFQVILVSGGSLSFVMINYGNISSTDQWFQAGYGTMNLTNYFSVPIPTANKLSNSSNVNLSGRWAFRVDGGPEEGLFYPHGDEDIKNPAEDFGSSPLIHLAQPFNYFGLIYNRLYVNNKGYLTFKEPFYQYYPNLFTAYYSTRDIIAPLWTDIDITRNGAISYRQVTDGHVLNRASRDVNQYFPNLNFSASWVFIATWDKVPYYGYRRSVSTFQIVLVSGKNMSFILMHYGSISQAPYQVQSGYDTTDSTDFFLIPVSDPKLLPYTSNVNMLGRWAFRIDNTSANNGLFCPFRNGYKVNMYYGYWISLPTPFPYYGLRHRLVKAGFDTADSIVYYKIPVSNITDLSHSTNVNFTGRWAFRVDTLTTEYGLFYPTKDSKLYCQSNADSHLQYLRSPFLYFKRKYYNISVNCNGYLTFNESFNEGSPKAFPGNSTRDIIAPLWTEFDSSVDTSVSYRIVNQGRILERATTEIKQYFPLFGFSVHTVLIATWNRVPYYNSSLSDSSFQVVLVMCRTFSFVIMNYGNISSTGQRFQAGYDTINSTNYFSIPLPDQNKLSKSSNVNVPGRWVFRVDGRSNEEIFYPYGDAEDEINPQSDDGSSPPIPLLQSFVYFGNTYDTIFVNNNGDLTFDKPLHQYNPDNFPAYSTRDIIAPLWTDINNGMEGTISYRQVTNGDILNRASKDINRYFPNLNFSASWVFIATWDKVPYYGYRESESTFQVVLVSDKKRSFTLMHYDYITYTQSAESGYDTNGSTVFYSIPVSDVTNLPYTSNVNVKGRWVFRVDNSSEVKGSCINTNSQALDSPSAAVCGIIPVNSSNGTVGGQNSSAVHWPWQASLYWYSGQTCGGSLINKEWVLSAAHCFNGQRNGFYLTVILGPKTQNKYDPSRISRSVKAVIKHPYYNPNTNDNDIALVRLSFPITFTDSIRPVCLAAEGSVFNSDTESWITTWRNISDGVPLPSPKIFQEVEVPVIGNRQCNCLYGVGSITDNMICAGLLKEGKDLCQGDSGGPMVSNQSSVWVQSGIVSFGSGCAQSEFPGVYTRVSRYQEWITYFTCSDPPGFVQFTSTGADPDYCYSCPGRPLLCNASAVVEQQKQLSAASISHNYMLSYFWLFLALASLFIM